MSNLPFRPPGPSHLALVRPEDIPPMPPGLLTEVRKWHRGKKFNVIRDSPEQELKVGEQVLAPWVGIECIDVDLHPTFYSISHVTTTSEDEDVAQDIWNHLVEWGKARRDGLTQHVQARCLFSEPRGY